MPAARGRRPPRFADLAGRLEALLAPAELAASRRSNDWLVEMMQELQQQVAGVAQQVDEGFV